MTSLSVLAGRTVVISEFFRPVLIEDKFGVEITTKLRQVTEKDQAGTYLVDLKPGEENQSTLTIHIKGDHPVELLHCEMLKKVRVFKLNDPKRVTDGLGTVILKPGKGLKISIHI